MWLTWFGFKACFVFLSLLTLQRFFMFFWGVFYFGPSLLKQILVRSNGSNAYQLGCLWIRSKAAVETKPDLLPGLRP